MLKPSVLKRSNSAAAALQFLLCFLMLGWLGVRTAEECCCECTTNNNTTNNIPFGVPIERVIGLLAGFTFITAVFHIVYATGCNGKYQKEIEDGRNWLRWFEYSMTASIMLVVIARSSGVHETWIVGLLATASVLCMVLGGLAEASKTRWVNIGATVLGWIVLLAAYSYILHTFVQTTKSSNVPGFVYGIVWSMFAMYMSFGLIHVVHLYKKLSQSSTETSNQRFELAYTVDSMVSKTLLVLLLFGGIVARSSDTA